MSRLQVTLTRFKMTHSILGIPEGKVMTSVVYPSVEIVHHEPERNLITIYLIGGGHIEVNTREIADLKLQYKLK